MMKRLGQLVVETRIGRGVAFMGIVIIVLGGAYAVVREEVGRQTRSIVRRVQVIEEAEPTEVIRVCLRMPKCRHLLRSARAVRANPEYRQASDRGGGALQPPHSGGQQPKPGHKPGGEVGKGGEHTAQDAPSPTVPDEPAPSPPSSSTAPPEPPSGPGNSGETPGAEAGAKTCVEVVVSACAEAGLPELP